MSDLLSILQALLGEAGFTMHLTTLDGSNIVCFEDDTLMGFGRIFEDPSGLLKGWRDAEMSLLTRYAPRLRTAGEKAWNVYCLFLCSAAADVLQNREVNRIEEDLDRTRKIAACGLASREDLKRALLPILPLQFQAELRPEDVTERLQTRIRAIAPKASKVALDDTVPVSEVVRLLGGST